MEALQNLYKKPGAPQSPAGLKKLLLLEGVSLSIAQIKNFLEDQRGNQIHRKRKLLNLNVQSTTAPFETWETDILELGPRLASPNKNSGFKYILVCVDKFSKMCFCEPLKKVDEVSVGKGMEKILQDVLKSYKMRPNHLTSDAGGAYISKRFAKLMEKYQISHKIVYMAYEAERSIRTIKEAIQQVFSRTDSKKWIIILQDLVQMLNKREHRGLKMSPNQAILYPEEALKNLESYWSKNKQEEPEIFKVGDFVRIRMEKDRFSKGHVAAFSPEVYSIKEVFPPEGKLKSHLYTLDHLDGVFNFNDLLLTKHVVTRKKEKVITKNRLQKQASKELRNLKIDMNLR